MNFGKLKDFSPKISFCPIKLLEHFETERNGKGTDKERKMNEKGTEKERKRNEKGTDKERERNHRSERNKGTETERVPQNWQMNGNGTHSSFYSLALLCLAFERIHYYSRRLLRQAFM